MSSGFLAPPSHNKYTSSASSISTNTSNLNLNTTSNVPIINDALSHDFPDLANSLSREEMNLLLEDDIYFDAYFNIKLPQVKEINQTLEMKLKSNIELAKTSESMKPELDKLRSETSSLFNEAVDLKMRWSLIQEAQEDAYKRFTPTPQLNRLRAATSLQEHLSESLVSSFLQGEIEEETFSRQYKEIRKVYFSREMRLNKWEDGKVVWR